VEEEGVRVTKLLRGLLGLGHLVVISGWELHVGDRAKLTVSVRVRQRWRGRCGRCGEPASWYDRGDGQRRWRHVDVGFATCELVCDAPRVDCPTHGPTVAEVPWARHDSRFSRSFEDLVVFDAIASNKLAASRRHEVSWRAVDGMCDRVLEEALGRVDLLDGLVAIAVDEVKYKKGQRYLTVVCDHFSGRVIWAAKGRSKDTVNSFFDALGEHRSPALGFVSCDGAEWIRAVVARRAPEAVVCLDSFHVVSWATKALDEVRRTEWNHLRGNGRAGAATEFKGMRWLLLRNWENLAPAQKATIRQLSQANTRTFRAWQLKEELREILAMPMAAAKAALESWLYYASRSRLEPFVRLARTIRHYRTSLEAAVEWKLNNGISESNNAAIGRIRSAARGFRDPQAFITMIMLDRAGIAPDLPWTTAS
jgi:transposase